MTEPTEAQLAEAMARAKARLASGGGDMGTLEKDFVPASVATASVLEGIPGVKPLNESEFQERIRREDAELLSTWEEDRKRAKTQKLIKQSELPAMFEEFGFSSFESGVSGMVERAFAQAKDYALGFTDCAAAGKGLILSGGVGTGKTHLAVAVMRYVLDQHEVPSLFVTVPGLLERERRSYDGETEGVIETAKGAELLVLDDLGAERVTDWAQEKLFYLVNHRYAQGLPIIATTNLGLAETAERIGARSMSRLAERCAWVPVKGEDYRLRALKGWS